MTDIEFFFDPSCPWTWVTSRWLATVAQERHLAVTWRPWSLPIKNQDQELPAHLPEDLKARIRAGQAFSARALRVLQAAGEGQGGREARGRLYTEMGRRFHGDGNGGGDQGSGGADQVIADSLAAAGLAASLAEAADDERWDQAIRATMAEVAEETGDDVGVPIVGIRVEGQLRAMAGPIMGEVPPLPRGLALWDAVATITAEPAAFELKRRRRGLHLPAMERGGSVTASGSVA